MAKTLQSSNITFIDLTDTKKLDVHISSNLPTTQIYDANTLKHSPDWTVGNKLVLTVTAYADSTNITNDLTDIKWYRQVGNADKGDPIKIGSTVLTIATNELTEPSVGGTVGVISYSCVVTYHGKAAENQITFSRTDTGKNGTDGADGTSVNIKGTATSVTPVENTDYYTIVYSDSSITLAEEGDAYVYNGDLYVCVGLQAADGTDYFINVGRIQGPAGENAKNIILSGNSQVFRVSKGNAITPSTITVAAQAINTSISNWTYSVNGGQSFVGTAPAGVVRNGNLITITGATLATNSLVIKVSDGVVEDVFTVYKVFDGSDGTQGAAGQSASMAFLTNENVTFSANASGQILATSFSTNVVAYNGTTKATPTIGTISNLPAGMTAQIGTVVNNEIPITFTIANNATLGSAISNNGSITIPVNGPVYTNLVLSWSKVNAGATGTSASLVDITPSALYFKSTTGKDGVFTPEYIYLYPRFQTVTFGKWEYSINGGTSWIAASGANGISIGTYNSIGNALRLARNSTLYTDTITSISFRCVGSNASVYDTVSIAKIYDVVDLQIGGRNYIQNSDQEFTKEVGATQAEYMVLPYDLTPIFEECGIDKTYTLSFDLRSKDITNHNKISVYPEPGTTPLHKYSFPYTTLTVTEEFKRYSITFVPTRSSSTNAVLSRISVYGTYNTGNIPVIKNLQLEIGNKASDWKPAIEDVDANITKVDTRLTNSLAEIKATTDSITSRVSATETSITTTNGKVTDLTNRVSTAEQKITPTAIVSTVRQSTDYTNDLGKKVGTSEIISKINQTAETITISANKIGLLGATNIPDLTADKIKGGTLTLGGSNATTQNGQLLVKNASNVDMVKLNKDGVVVKSGHLAVAEDFANSTYDWSTNTWTTTTNTRQLDLGYDYIRMGVYSPSGYSNYMRLLDDGLYFQGNAQGVGSWGSFIGHDSYGDFVIQDTVRGYIVFKGTDDDTEIANLGSSVFNINVPVVVSGGIQGNMSFNNNSGVRTTNTDGRDISLIRVNSQNTLVIGEASGGGVSRVSMDGVYGNTSTSAANMLVDSGNRLYRSTSSSQRYKTDIRNIQSEDLKPEKLYDLQVKEFKYKEGYLSTEDPRIDTFVPGFIAEEVAEVYPVACEYDGEKPEDWNIRFMVPAMLKLIQDQKKEIDTLKELIGNKEVRE